MNNSPYKEGYKAYITEGTTVHSNPYDIETVQYDKWLEGWNDALEADKLNIL